jgi:hypothetical protein
MRKVTPEQTAQELTESFINGNLTAVRTKIHNMPRAKAVLVSLFIYDALPELQRLKFLRLMQN